MKNLLTVLVFTLLINLLNAQSTQTKAFDKINDSKNINEFLELEKSDKITNFSIALVIDTKLTAFPYDGKQNLDLIFNKIKAELNNALDNSTVRIIVADLEYASKNENMSNENLVYNITDIPNKNTMASR